jgi:hypothetical protein
MVVWNCGLEISLGLNYWFYCNKQLLQW